MVFITLFQTSKMLLIRFQVALLYPNTLLLSFIEDDSDIVNTIIPHVFLFIIIIVVVVGISYYYPKKKKIVLIYYFSLRNYKK